LPHDDRATLDLLRQAATTGPACGHATLPGGGTARWFIPDNADALATLLAQYPGARIVAGATDVGLWVTKKLVDLDTVIFVGDVPELNALAESADGLTIGGAVRYADAHAALSASALSWANWCGASAVCRCAMPAPSAAISPMALPSAMARRR
jgi:xanthine dehydrogenase small subunit